MLIKYTFKMVLLQVFYFHICILEIYTIAIQCSAGAKLIVMYFISPRYSSYIVV